MIHDTYVYRSIGMSTREIQSFLSQHYNTSTSSFSTSLVDGAYYEEAECVGMGEGKDLSFSVVLPTLHRLRMISYMGYTIVWCLYAAYSCTIIAYVLYSCSTL